MQVVKGGGLFGMFQQDTVYADGGAEEAAPPATEVVERAVTKKGSGRKSVKELLGKKGGDAAADSEPAAPAAAEVRPLDRCAVIDVKRLAGRVSISRGTMGPGRFCCAVFLLDLVELQGTVGVPAGRVCL